MSLNYIEWTDGRHVPGIRDSFNRRYYRFNGQYICWRCMKIIEAAVVPLDEDPTSWDAGFRWMDDLTAVDYICDMCKVYYKGIINK